MASRWPASIEWQARDFEKRTGIVCAVSVPAEDLPLTRAQSVALFRIFQEALTNVARHAGAALSRAFIAGQVWDMNFDSDTNVIDVAVRRLRAKIDDDFDVKLIRTVRGMGYVLESPDK